MTASGSGRPPRRPPLGARTPVSRPRKVAGRQGPAADPSAPVEPVEQAVEPDEPAREPEDQRDEAVVDAPDAHAHDGDADVDDDEPAEDDWPTEDARRPPSRRATSLLVAVIVLLAGLASAEAWYLWGDDDPVVSTQRPIVIGQVNAASAVDVAASSAKEISQWSYETYDEDTEADAALMTEEFASRFRETKADARERVMQQKTAVTAEVAMQGVVRASPEQVVALVYLDQSNTTDGKDSSFSQYMILVTVVRTGSGWLVSRMETF
jgi:Mce-associated membrane protein